MGKPQACAGITREFQEAGKKILIRAYQVALHPGYHDEETATAVVEIDVDGEKRYIAGLPWRMPRGRNGLAQQIYTLAVAPNNRYAWYRESLLSFVVNVKGFNPLPTLWEQPNRWA